MIIALLTDFGTENWYVSSMKGVIRKLGKQYNFYPEIIDITHEIHSFGICQAAFSLLATYKYFPEGTVFCAVVDPGVGSERRIVALATEKFYFIAPDNGVLSYIIKSENVTQVIHVIERNYFLKDISMTFHGRDIFAPCAFHIARAQKISELGPDIEKSSLQLGDCPDLVKDLKESFEAKVIILDKFGNLLTNIPSYYSEEISFVVQGNKVPCYQAYTQADPGEIFCIKGSSGFLEVSVREGSAAEVLGKVPGSVLEYKIR